MDPGTTQPLLPTVTWGENPPRSSHGGERGHAAIG